MMWTKKPELRRGIETAENAGKQRAFSTSKPTAPKGENCYPFETFARLSRDIRSAYDYHY
jgi:hypothetical protein